MNALISDTILPLAAGSGTAPFVFFNGLSAVFRVEWNLIRCLVARGIPPCRVFYKAPAQMPCLEPVELALVSWRSSAVAEVVALEGAAATSSGPAT
jgi:hypothetical protein